MEKQIWKITTIVLLIGCIILGYSVYDAEKRVDLVSDRREELREQVRELEREIKTMEDEGTKNLQYPQNYMNVAKEAKKSLEKYIESVERGESLEKEDIIVIKLMFNQLATYTRFYLNLNAETVIKGVFGGLSGTLTPQDKVSVLDSTINITQETDIKISESVSTQQIADDNFISGLISDTEYIQELKTNCEEISKYLS